MILSTVGAVTAPDNAQQRPAWMLAALHADIDDDECFVQESALDDPAREGRIVVMIEVHDEA